MAFPNDKFPIPSEAATASYDWNDIASGTGYLDLFLCHGRSSAGSQFYLSDNEVILPTTTDNKVETGTPVDFDLTPFNTPRTVGGVAYFGGYIPTTGDNVTCQVKKYDGTTETNISSAVASHTTIASGENVSFKLDITETNFKRGDILRITITVTGLNGEYLVDPQGLTGNASKLTIPFKIDL